MAKKKSQKGVAGDNTGPAARKAIADQRKEGSTTEDMAIAAKRSADTILAIETQIVKNPPASVVAAIRKAKSSSDSPTKKSKASKAKADASRKKHN